MRIHTTLGLALAAMLAACDGGGTGGAGGMGGSAGGSGGSGGSPGGMGGTPALIPDPGTDIAVEWTDEEPNDAPENAVPVGQVEGPIWAGFVMPLTAINPEDDVDYFVFQTGAAPTLDSVYISLCWSFAGDLLDLRLYEVQNGLQGPMVAEAATTNPGCETIVDFGMGSTILTANTVYLLEVAAAPGLVLGGDSGDYGA